MPFSEKRTNLAYVFCSMLFFAGYFVFFPVVYEQNDDLWLKLISNGYFTGQSDYHLVYTNNFLGLILQFFYQISTKIEWYDFMMISFLGISFFSNLYFITKYETNNKKLILSLFNLLLIYFFSRLQFSYVAGFLAISAIIAQYYARKEKKRQFLPLIFSVVLMLISSMIRFEMFVFTYAVFFLVFIFKLNKIHQYKIIFLGLLLVLFGKLIHNYQYNSNPEWEKYFQFNKYRQTSVANSNIDYSKINLIQIGLQRKDIDLIQNYIFTKNVTTEKMKQISQQNKGTISLHQIFVFSWGYMKPYVACVFFLLFLSLITRNFRVAAAIALHIVFLVITMKFVNNVQYRILYPTLFGIVFFLLQNLQYKKKLILSFYIIVLTACFIFAIRDIRHTKLFAERNEQYIQKIESQLNGDRVYVVDPHTNMNLYSRIAFRNPKVKTIFFGWITNFTNIKAKYQSV